VSNRAAGIGSGEHGHDGGDPQLGQPVRMGGGVGREVDCETGLDGRGDQAPVLDSDGVATKDGLVGEGDSVLASVGGERCCCSSLCITYLKHIVTRRLEFKGSYSKTQS
jgi:hypothetical protein